ncbi:DUF559 domain-containing protein, partial [Plantactinospora endophytica]
RRPPQLRGRIFRGSQVVARGLLTKHELRSSAWRPLFRDIYADAELTVAHHTRCAVVGRFLLPEGAAIAGRSAAALYGATTHADEDGMVEVAVPSGTRFGPMAGLRVHTATLAPDDIRLNAGVPVTSPVRTCWDLARWVELVETVALVDQLLARRVVAVSELRDYALGRAGDRGWRLTLRAADLADPGSESPQESRLRVRLVLAGLPRPETQYVVHDRGRFVARVDLAWPDAKVAVEYDGLWHNHPEQFHRDRRRLNRLLDSGWLVLHVTAQRMRDDFAGLLAELRAALRRRR